MKFSQGSTLYALVDEATTDTIEKIHSQFHVLIIVADGRIVPSLYHSDLRR